VTGVVPLEFAATVVGGGPATRADDGFSGYLFGLAEQRGGPGPSLVVQRADEQVPEWQPYCLVWGDQEGTTYGGVRSARVTEGEVSFELLAHNAAELGTPTRFRIAFPVPMTAQVRLGLVRTLGAELVR